MEKSVPLATNCDVLRDGHASVAADVSVLHPVKEIQDKVRYVFVAYCWLLWSWSVSASRRDCYLLLASALGCHPWRIIVCEMLCVRTSSTVPRATLAIGAWPADGRFPCAQPHLRLLCHVCLAILRVHLLCSGFLVSFPFWNHFGNPSCCVVLFSTARWHVQWFINAVNTERQMLAATHGAALPLSMMMEERILGQFHRLGSLRSEFVGLESLSGRDQKLTFEDVLGDPAEGVDAPRELHSVMEAKLGMTMPRPI